MRTRPTLLLASIALAALWSCQDPIDLTLPDGQTRLIVNGSVSDNQPVYADLSWSVNYLSEASNPAVENATVVLYENGLPVDTLVHVLDGHYEGDFVGSYAQSYHVSVTLPETGDLPFGTWQSSPEAMGRCNPFDSIYSAFVPRAPLFAKATTSTHTGRNLQAVATTTAHDSGATTRWKMPPSTSKCLTTDSSMGVRTMTSTSPPSK